MAEFSKHEFSVLKDLLSCYTTEYNYKVEKKEKDKRMDYCKSMMIELQAEIDLRNPVLKD